MDALIRVRTAADGLLAQVDGTLARHGAPDNHDIWSLLRKSKLLPGDAVEAIAGWLPPVLAGRAALLRRQAEAQAEVAASLDAPSTWEGVAAEAFRAALQETRAELANARHTAEQMAQCLEELAEWLASARHQLARTLADVLVSTEAVTLGIPAPLTSPAVQAKAAASIGATVLAEVDRFWSTGLEIWHRHEARLTTAPDPLLQADFSASSNLHVET